MSKAPAKGDSLPPVRMGPVALSDLIAYAHASGDHNPIHTDESFARAHGQDGVIAHGMLTMAHVGRMLTNFAGDAADIVDFGVRFRAVVRLADVVTCRAAVTRVEETQEGSLVTLTLDAVNQNNEMIVKGSATLCYP